jgi:hypothetical protein
MAGIVDKINKYLSEYEYSTLNLRASDELMAARKKTGIFGTNAEKGKEKKVAQRKAWNNIQKKLTGATRAERQTGISAAEVKRKQDAHEKEVDKRVGANMVKQRAEREKKDRIRQAQAQAKHKNRI